MNIVHYSPESLVSLLNHHNVATMPQLKEALGTSVTYTVLRKLSPLGYRTSYSHGGIYYTLDSIANYDELGLWFYRDIRFSRYGTLLNTSEALVAQSPAGYQVPELEARISPLGYRTSYSHGGIYYTLDSIANYDELGLWFYRDIRFSRYGTLLNTSEALVAQSPAGYQVPELEAVVRGAASAPGPLNPGLSRWLLPLVPHRTPHRFATTNARRETNASRTTNAPRPLRSGAFTMQ